MRKDDLGSVLCTIPSFAWGTDKSHRGLQVGYSILVLKFGAVRSEILDLDLQ